MSEQATPAMNFDVAKILTRVREVATNPTGVWSLVRAESLDIPSIYREYLLVLAAIAPVAQLIVAIYAGAPVFSSIVGAGVHYGASLLFYFAAAAIIELLGPRFDCAPTREDAFRLLAFSAFPALAAGVLMLLIPVLGAVASFLLLGVGLYSVYILWEGMLPMLGVSAERRPQLFICVAGCVILFGVLLQSL